MKRIFLVMAFLCGSMVIGQGAAHADCTDFDLDCWGGCNTDNGWVEKQASGKVGACFKWRFPWGSSCHPDNCHNACGSMRQKCEALFSADALRKNELRTSTVNGQTKRIPWCIVRKSQARHPQGSDWWHGSLTCN